MKFWPEEWPVGAPMNRDSNGFINFNLVFEFEACVVTVLERKWHNKCKSRCNIKQICRFWRSWVENSTYAHPPVDKPKILRQLEEQGKMPSLSYPGVTEGILWDTTPDYTEVFNSTRPRTKRRY